MLFCMSLVWKLAETSFLILECIHIFSLKLLLHSMFKYICIYLLFKIYLDACMILNITDLSMSMTASPFECRIPLEDNYLVERLEIEIEHKNKLHISLVLIFPTKSCISSEWRCIKIPLKLVPLP